MQYESKWTLETFMEYIMNNCKTSSQIKKDLDEGKCTIHSYRHNVNPHTRHNIDEVSRITYTDGLTFYRQGNEFNSSDLIEYHNEVERIKHIIKTEEDPIIVESNRKLLRTYFPCS